MPKTDVSRSIRETRSRLKNNRKAGQPEPEDPQLKPWKRLAGVLAKSKQDAQASYATEHAELEQLVKLEIQNLKEGGADRLTKEYSDFLWERSERTSIRNFLKFKINLREGDPWEYSDFDVYFRQPHAIDICLPGFVPHAVMDEALGRMETRYLRGLNPDMTHDLSAYWF